MSNIVSQRSRTNGPLWFAIVLFLFICLVGRARADVVLYTASTDASGFGSGNAVSVPNINNPYIPSIDPSVTVTPNPGLLDGNTVGPLNGITYGPFGYGLNTGGTTGFVNVSYTIATSGMYQLIWEVASTTASPGDSALATDNVQLNGASLFNFQAGGPGVLPTGLMGAGTYGTSGAIPDLTPSGTDTAFAWIDTTGGLTPMYDTVDGNSASRLMSTTFSATSGDTLSLDAAFLTNDGGPFDDYGIVVLVAVPEPSSLSLLLASAGIGVGVFALRCRRLR